MESKLNCLAITGGMGSGKSTVLDLFEKNGFTVFSLDKLAHQLLNSSSIYYTEYSKEIDNWLGTNYQSQNEINRDEFRKIIKNTENGFNILGTIAKPYLLKLMHNEYNKYILNNSDNKIVFEVPLLGEFGMENMFSEILVITCNLDVRVNRISKRDPHLTRDDIIQRINLQSSDNDKEKIATYVIDNSDNEKQLNEDFNQFFNLYINLKKQKKCFIVK